MKKITQWIRESDRWKHLAGGLLIGLGADGWHCAAYAGIGVAAALELKDRLWGGEWDWADFALTSLGAFAGQALRAAIPS